MSRGGASHYTWDRRTMYQGPAVHPKGYERIPEKRGATWEGVGASCPTHALALEVGGGAKATLATPHLYKEGRGWSAYYPSPLTLAATYPPSSPLM
jgi:hypothetical protein